MTETVVLHAFGDVDRSGKVRWLAHELGLEVADIKVGYGEHREDPYKTLNPFRQIPTAEFRGETLMESTAICHAIAESFDEPKLYVERGESKRHAYLFWLALFGESLEARLVECAVSRAGLFGPEYFSLHENGLRFKLKVAASRLPQTGYLCGERFTVADVLAGYNLRLAIDADLVDRSLLEPYLGRLVARPAAKKSRIFATLGD